jgi:Histidine kinase-, DNA gyrase B-, and HSP90-like ATPase
MVRPQADATTRNGFGSIAVLDNGMGVPVALRETILELFYQGPASSGATGLGLTTARRLVEGQGGSILMETAPGGGSRLAFTFPGRSRQRWCGMAIRRCWRWRTVLPRWTCRESIWTRKGLNWWWRRRYESAW